MNNKIFFFFCEKLKKLSNANPAGIKKLIIAKTLKRLGKRKKSIMGKYSYKIFRTGRYAPNAADRQKMPHQKKTFTREDFFMKTEKIKNINSTKPK